ncbi:glycosyltransferase [Photobacterium lipolyticum]|uniref:Glycosyltransferase family 1 protein n=1 Tax=Photobacterium lipolyticum TaxID=266810 RepID=A0A2T3N0M8_9GAMM|nr:glycosyltransferase [Photobacterium lipolyticum]PSW05760.1 glycosyltransferase family 1 protein [Photobacterium lipolyticum]
MTENKLNRSGKDNIANNRKNILFVHYGEGWIRGSERCLLDLLTFLDSRNYRPVLWCNSEVLKKEAEELNIPTICQPFPLLFAEQPPRFNCIGFYQLVRQGMGLVKQYNIDLIHANSGAPCQWLNWVARACQLPLVAHIHSRYPLWQRWVLGLHQVDHVIGVSHPVIEQLRGDGMAESKLSVIANGVAIQNLSQQPVVDLRQKLHLSPGTFLIAAVGSLIFRKGFDIAIEACAALEKQGVDLHLVIIGEGEQRANLEQQLSELKLEHRVTLLGEQPDVVGHLKGGCDLLLSTAREEVFGLVLLEAALAGVAVAAPRVGGIPEVIVDRQTGLLHQPGDVDELVSHLKALMLAPELRVQLAAASYERLQVQFSIQANVFKVTAQYEQLITAYSNHALINTDIKSRGTSWFNLLRSIAHSDIWQKYWPKRSPVV